MTHALNEALNAKLDLIPTCSDYSELLSIVHSFTGLDLDTIRKGRGEWTYKDWALFLQGLQLGRFCQNTPQK